MSERVDSDSDAPEEFTSEQGFKVDELIRKVQKENKDRVVREGKERRKQWAERKTPRPSKENENVKEVLEVSEAEKETPGAYVMHAESTPSTDGMLPENIVQMLAAREKKVFASDSEDEKTEEKPRLRKKKLKITGIETVVLNGPKSEKLAQNSLEFLKKKRMEVPRLTSILKHKNQTRLETRRFVPSAKNRTFKFEIFWIREEGCLEVIQNSWASSAGKDIQDQLKICGLELDSWGRNLSNQIRERINAQKKVLGKARGRRDRGSLSELIAAEKELNRLLKCEEDFWRQRAKIFWLQSGDLNT